VPSHVASTRPFDPLLLPRARSLQQCHPYDAALNGRSSAAIAWGGGSSSHAWEDVLALLLCS
jgi:hypothetical protein